jgi:hypothetical protein
MPLNPLALTLCYVVETNWEFKAFKMLAVTVVTVGAADDDDEVMVVVMLQGCRDVQVYSTTFSYFFTHMTVK